MALFYHNYAILSTVNTKQTPAYDLAEDDEIGMVELTPDTICEE